MNDRPQLVVWTSLWGPTLPAMMGEQEQRRRFSYALQEAMAERKVSVRALAKVLSLDARRITGWRDGKALPNLYESQRLAMALRVDEELFRNPPEVPPPPPKPYYPLERYLLEAAESGKAEGRRRAASDLPAADPGTPPRKPARRAHAGEGGRG